MLTSSAKSLTELQYSHVSWGPPLPHRSKYHRTSKWHTGTGLDGDSAAACCHRRVEKESGWVHALELPGICPNHSSSQYWWDLVGKTLKEPFVDGSVSVRSQTPKQQWTQTPWVAFGKRVAQRPNTSCMAAASYMSDMDDLLETAMEIAMMDSRFNGCFHRK